MRVLTHACFNLGKACLALNVSNIPNWPKFLALEALVFLPCFYFFDFAVF